MLCAARAQIGPLSQSFWVLWDRGEGRAADHTHSRPAAAKCGWNGPRIEIERAACAPLHSARRPRSNRSPSGSGLGLDPQTQRVCRSRARSRSRPPLEVAGHGIDDESAGYHQRHTSWRWSAGVGAPPTAGAGLELVEGVNDPAEHSERAIWIAGEPYEPAPVRFDGVAAIDFAAGDPPGLQPRIGPRARRQLPPRPLPLPPQLRHLHRLPRRPSSSPPPASAVMEEHDAVW